jgi:NTP pyrophosphatase (non-canonical NTP hydrolase)
MKTQLEHAVIEWAAAKGLNRPEKQYYKLVDELGELSGALLEESPEKIKDEACDVLVVTTVLHHLLGGTFPDLFVKTNYEFEMSMLVYAISNIQTHTNSRDWIWNQIARLLGGQEEAELALQAAYEKIIKRTGKTINGTFVKD